MNFKARLIVLVSACIVLTVCICLVLFTILLNVSNARFSEEAIRGKSLLWQKVMAVQLDKMSEATKSLTRARDFLKPLRKMDKAGIAEEAIPPYNLLSASGIISKLQVVDKEGNVVFSKPHKFSGLTKKKLVMEALKDNKVHKGLERDDDGMLVAEVAFPLYYRGKMIGAGIYMQDIEAAINILKEADGSEIHLLSLENKLEKSTNSEQFKLLRNKVEKDAELIQKEYSVGELITSAVKFPVFDNDNNLIASLLVVTDYTHNYKEKNRIYWSGGIIGLIAFAVMLSLVYGLIYFSFKPMNHCLSIIKSISSGDLTGEFKADRHDEFGLILRGLKLMQRNLKNMIVGISEAASHIEISNEKLEKATQNSTSSIDQQFAISQELVNNINSLVEASEAVSQNTTGSHQSTQDADTQISQGKTVVQDSVDTSYKIAKQISSAKQVVQSVFSSSKDVESLVGVIKGIAEQTNLLALNAAIEAARAGEQGRGFAIVADEVRTLASKTSESTNTIESIIGKLRTETQDAVDKISISSEMVSSGVERTNETDESFNQIAASVTLIGEKSQDIILAVSNQIELTDAMKQMVENISCQSKKTAQGNVVTIHSIKELNHLASELKENISQFQV